MKKKVLQQEEQYLFLLLYDQMLLEVVRDLFEGVTDACWSMKELKDGCTWIVLGVLAFLAATMACLACSLTRFTSSCAFCCANLAPSVFCCNFFVFLLKSWSISFNSSSCFISLTLYVSMAFSFWSKLNLYCLELCLAFFLCSPILTRFCLNLLVHSPLYHSILESIFFSIYFLDPSTSSSVYV